MIWRTLFVFICIIIEKAINTYLVEQNDRCMAVPNAVMAGREALLIFQEMNSYGPKLYTYQVDVIHIKYIDIESIAKSAYDKWFLFFISVSSSYHIYHIQIDTLFWILPITIPGDLLKRGDVSKNIFVILV